VEKTKFSVLLGIAFISCATLAFEIALSRYLSIAQNYHFAFLVISLAFLGYGASGSFLTLCRGLAERHGHRWLSWSSLLFGLSIPVSFLLYNSLPFDFLRLPWDRKQIFYLWPAYILLSFPFFFAGATISFALTRQAKVAHRIYFADLVGAGIGSVFAGLSFLPRGEKGVFLIISVLALVGCLFLSLHRRRIFFAGLAALFLIEAWAFFSSPDWLSFRISPFKGLPQALRYPAATHHLIRVDPISRIDILSSPAVRFAPGLSLLYSRPLPPQLGLSIDGGELCAVTKVDSWQDGSLAFLTNLPSSLPYYLLRRPKVLILDPRGGLDVLTALYFNATQVKGVESYPLLVHLLKGELSSFSGGIYSHPGVSVVSSHPRVALKKEISHYDLIVFGLPDIFGSAGTGIYGIGENYLYTVESCLDVLSLLTEEGIVSQTMYLLPPPRLEAKTVTMWTEALEKKGLDPAAHIAAIRTWGTLSIFIKKRPFDSHDIKMFREFCRERLFDIVYFPNIQPEETNLFNQMTTPIYEDLFRQLLTSSGRKALLKDYLFDISPARDNRPFIHDFYKWRNWKKTYTTLGRNPAFFFEGKFLLLVLLGQAALAALLFIALPLAGLKKSVKSIPHLVTVLLYFSFLGAAFMLIEIIFIQKFILFLGHPLYSISTVILAFLLSSGLGSLSSKRILGPSPRPKLRVCLFILVVLGLIYLQFLPTFLNKFIGCGLTLKIPLLLGIIFPLGFLMGFPFPTGLRLLQTKSPPLLPWAWSANAFSTVIHSVLAHLLALSLGYGIVLLLAAGAYLIAIPLLCFANHGHKADA